MNHTEEEALSADVPLTTNSPTHPPTLFAKLRKLLTKFSLGTYRTSFTFSGKQDHSSIVSSIVTLLLIVLMALFGVQILIGVFTYQQYTLKN